MNEAGLLAITRVFDGAVPEVPAPSDMAVSPDTRPAPACPGMVTAQVVGPSMLQRARAMDSLRAMPPLSAEQLAPLVLTLQDFRTALPRFVMWLNDSLLSFTFSFLCISLSRTHTL